MKSPAGMPGGAFCVQSAPMTGYDARMDTLPEKTPEQRIAEALARSEAQVAAGETVPLEPALQAVAGEHRARDGRPKTGKRSRVIRLSAEAEHQLDALIAHYEARGRSKQPATCCTRSNAPHTELAWRPDPASRPRALTPRSGQQGGTGSSRGATGSHTA